jgi:hypothetical protein
MLFDLYEIVKSAEGKNDLELGNRVEFTSYRIVYLTMINNQRSLVKIINSVHDGIDNELFKLAIE